MRFNGKKALIVKLESQQKSVETLTAQLRNLNLEIGETLNQLKEESTDPPVNKEYKSIRQTQSEKEEKNNVVLPRTTNNPFHATATIANQQKLKKDNKTIKN